MSEGLILAITLVIGLGVAVVLIATMVRAIQRERRSSIHQGSAESRDGTDRIEQAVRRIEKRLDAAGIGSTGSA